MNYFSFGLEGLKRAFLYSWHKPHLLLLAITQSFHQRMLIPLDSLRWLLHSLLPNTGRIKGIDIQPQPPGFRIAMELEVMDTILHLEGTIRVSSVKMSPDQCRIVFDISDLSIKAPPESSITTMLGMIDLTKPGLLLEWLPSLPTFIVETNENQITLDMWKISGIQARPKLQKFLGALSYVLAIREIRVGNQAVVIQAKTNSRRLARAIQYLLHSKKNIQRQN